MPLVIFTLYRIIITYRAGHPFYFSIHLFNIFCSMFPSSGVHFLSMFFFVFSIIFFCLLYMILIIVSPPCIKFFFVLLMILSHIFSTPITSFVFTLLHFFKAFSTFDFIIFHYPTIDRKYLFKYQSRLFTDRTPYNTIDFKAVKTKRWDCFTL